MCSRLTATLVFGLLLCCTLGCAKSPYQQRREWQQQYAKSHAPAALERTDRSWRAIRTLRARVYVDPAFTKAEGNVTAHCEERFARANAVLEPALGLRIALDAVRELPAEANGADLDAVLSALPRVDPSEDVELVIALVGAQPLATLEFQALGRARLLGSYLVLRGVDSAAELRALEGYDTFDAEERSGIYQQRKRHKEATILLHEIGHSLGALHVRDRADIMHPRYDLAMQTFAPENLELMRLTADERLRAPEERDYVALAQAHKARLQSVDAEQSPFVVEERSEQLALLTQTIEQRPAAQSSGVSGAARTADAASAAPPAELAEADRTRFAALDEQLRQHETQAVHDAIFDLARRYPDSYAVQHKACQLGMQLALTFKELQPLCDRMAVLANTPAGSEH